MKRFLSLILALTLCMALCVPSAAAADNSVRQIEAGNGFSLVVTNDGTLYGCGANHEGLFEPYVTATNDPSVGSMVTRPQKIAEGVREVAANVDRYANGLETHGNHFLILMENGDLYAMGNNYFGQLGQGDKNEHEGMVYVMSDVEKISCGKNSSVCVTTDGDLYYWGLMWIPFGDYALTYKPTRVMGDVKEVSAGGDFVAALKEDGTVWTFDSNAYGARGNGLKEGIDMIPNMAFEGAVSIAAGGSHMLVMTENGDVYGWGWNDVYQVGLGMDPDDEDKILYTPTYVMSGAKAIEAAYDNSWVVKENGDLWGFGATYFGQLGLGYSDYSGAPIKTATNVKAVSAGYRFTLILKEDGSTYGTGNSYYYELGNGTNLYRVLAWTPALLTASPILEEGSMAFTDVKQGDYFYDAVQWAVDERITTGTTATTFSPNDLCNRAQIITFLWRAAGSVAPYRINQFTDTDKNAYYFSALRWAQQSLVGEEPILYTYEGCGFKFYPESPCTRATAVEFMWKYAGSPAYDTSALPFKDVKASDSYAQAVAWALDQRITTGTSATTFSPNATCTRGQIATFLYRAFA